LLMRAEAGKLDHVWFAEDTTGAIMSGQFNSTVAKGVCDWFLVVWSCN
jgi:hypothetical protein